MVLVVVVNQRWAPPSSLGFHLKEKHLGFQFYENKILIMSW
jgi:hypothetical protein